MTLSPPKPVQIRKTASAGTANVVSNIYCKVLSVDPQSNVAHVIDQMGANRTISLLHLIGKTTNFPQIGETWIITSLFGNWMFAVQVSPPNNIGTTAARPTSPYVGQEYFDTTLNRPIWYGNTGWINASGTAV